MSIPSKIAVAGASGFVGSQLIPKLLESFPNSQIIAITRSQLVNPSPRFETRQADLFSLLQTERALGEVDVAVYLVHSMLRQSALSQGGFQDFDFIVADNFARSAKLNGVKKIIYLSGIIPPGEELSGHLKSRLEVERTLSSYGTQVISLRAGIVIGPGGSSFTMVEKLVDKLPMMLCPQWTQSECQPVDIEDITDSIVECIQMPSQETEYFDVGCEEKVTYLGLMKEVARQKNKKRWFFTVPAFSPKLSVLWVSLVTGAPGKLVRPLVQSLKHAMLLDPEHSLGRDFISLPDSITKAIREDKKKTVSRPQAFRAKGEGERQVRSVQRLHLPKSKNARWVAECYMDWLPRFFHIIQVKKRESTVRFQFLGKSLLTLRYAPDRSDDHRSLFFIDGGLLVKRRKNARFEFRETRDGNFVIAAIHNFSPSLPWWVYRLTQALLHVWVMNRFASYLKRIG